QLNRSVETREGHRPRMSDLRESGSIEQDADVIILMHREDYYDENHKEKNKVELNIAKQRNGPTGKVTLTFRREFLRFENYQKNTPLDMY
ncbi:MAG: DnaB-like helicase C-terminal domain-containing protein, partial [Candidatus Scalindua sediminis]